MVKNKPVIPTQVEQKIEEEKFPEISEALVKKEVQKVTDFEYHLVINQNTQLSQNRAKIIKLQEDMYQLLQQNEELKKAVLNTQNDLFTKYKIPANSSIELSPDKTIIFK